MNYPEPLVARVTGLSRGKLKELRDANLTKGTGWVLEDSVVAYTPEGLKNLLAAAGVEPAGLEWPGEWPGALATPQHATATPPSGTVAEEVKALQTAAAARPVVELTVVRCSPNPSIVYAQTGEGKQVLVRVRENGNFRPAMKLQARAPATGGTLYLLIGHCPRWPGRW